MNLIAAVDRNWGIGKDGQLLVRIREDMRYFAGITTGHVIVMGRKTLESFPGGKPLANRVNIVLTRDRTYEGRGAVPVHDEKELFDRLEDYPSEEVYVCGGGSIYRLLLPYCSAAYITEIEKEFEADTFMPDLGKEPGWYLKKEGEVKEEKGIRFQFNVYENRKPLSF